MAFLTVNHIFRDLSFEDKKRWELVINTNQIISVQRLRDAAAQYPTVFLNLSDKELTYSYVKLSDGERFVIDSHYDEFVKLLKS